MERGQQDDLEAIEERCEAHASDFGEDVTSFQSATDSAAADSINISMMRSAESQAADGVGREPGVHGDDASGARCADSSSESEHDDAMEDESMQSFAEEAVRTAVLRASMPAPRRGFELHCDGASAAQGSSSSVGSSSFGSSGDVSAGGAPTLSVEQRSRLAAAFFEKATAVVAQARAARHSEHVAAVRAEGGWSADDDADGGSGRASAPPAAPDDHSCACTVRNLVRAAEMNVGTTSCEAAALLGQLLCEGTVAAFYPERGLAWLRVAAAAGHTPALHAMASILFALHLSEDERVRAEEDALIAAHAASLTRGGDGSSSSSSGSGVGAPLRRSANRFRDAAELSKSPLLRDCAHDCVRWLIASADAGCTRSMLLLSECYFEGWFLSSADAAASAAMLRRAAERGDTNAMTKLACRLVSSSQPADKVEGAALLRRASELGHCTAQEFMGAMLVCGDDACGVAPDAAAAAALLQRSVDGGSRDAPLVLATLLLQGRGGVPQDAERGTALLAVAAERGNGTARMWLRNLAESTWEHTANTELMRRNADAAAAVDSPHECPVRAELAASDSATATAPVAVFGDHSMGTDAV